MGQDWRGVSGCRACDRGKSTITGGLGLERNGCIGDKKQCCWQNTLINCLFKNQRLGWYMKKLLVRCKGGRRDGRF